MALARALNKNYGAYCDSIENSFYAICPKAVFAAIAASAYLNGAITGPDGGTPDPTPWLAREWVTLHAQGLVDSKPPKIVRDLAAKTETE